MVENGATENQTNMSGGSDSPELREARQRIDAGLPVIQGGEDGILVVIPRSEPYSPAELLARETAFAVRGASRSALLKVSEHIHSVTTPDIHHIRLKARAVVNTLGALAAGTVAKIVHRSR